MTRPRGGSAWLCTALVGLALPAVASVESRDLQVGAFQRVHFSGSGTVHLTQGDVPQLSVHGSARALDGLRIETRDGALYIDAPNAAADVVLDLRVARLTSFVSEGDGRITGSDLNFDALLLEGAGSGSFDLQRLRVRDLEVHGEGATEFDFTGQVQNHVVRLTGSGAYRAMELISDCVSVRVAGDSDVGLWADDSLHVNVDGAARIRYAGSPRVEQRVSGLARVLRLPGIVI